MKPILNQVSLIFGVLMIVLVISGAIAIIFTDFLSERLYGNKRTIFAIILVAYAIYRGFRMYQVFKERKDEE
jgi:hypothetical protein